MKIHKKLNKVQTTLKANKGQFNKIGGYYYRSCEDILEAVKPLLANLQVSVLLSDDIVAVGNRIYVKATATLVDVESGAQVSSSAFAREAEDRKGMSAEQVTGSASSYARKYALNGLFCIDDCKDADVPQNHQGSTTQNNQKFAKREDLEMLKNLANKKGVPMNSILGKYHVKNPEQLTEAMFRDAINILNTAYN